MQILQVVLQVFSGITSLLLTLLILLHRGRGGGLSDMFGGGVTSNLGASGVAERNLNRITVILGLIWITCIIVLGLITKFDTAGIGEISWHQAVAQFVVRASARAQWASRIADIHADRIQISYWDALGNETVRHFAATCPRKRFPRRSTRRQSGLARWTGQGQPAVGRQTRALQNSSRLRERAPHRR